jgi:hypothetical protein
MTCLEKYLQENPDRIAEEVIVSMCPDLFNIMDEPDFCDHNPIGDACVQCWNREIPNAPIIKDSGERRQFDTGAVRDIQVGKGRMDLLPWSAIMEVSKHCEAGALKYGEHNVDKGIPTHSLCDSAARHLAKYLEGWTDEPHLLAAAWNLLWAIQMEIKRPECVDTPWSTLTNRIDGGSHENKNHQN